MTKAIEIEGFSYTYSDGTSALSDINLSIGQGEKVALIGPNGAGKSTLLLAMSVFVKGSGSIAVDGIELCDKNARKVRTIIGSVLQNPDEQLFMPRLFDDVSFGPLNMGFDSAEVTRRTEKALRTVGLEGMGQKSPHHLSAGQKRSAAIATILSMDPKIITMDEPDSNLDPRNRNNLIELLRLLEQTLVIATCNMDFASKVCDRAVLISGGVIVADGGSREIMSDPSLMKEHGLEVPSSYVS